MPESANSLPDPGPPDSAITILIADDSAVFRRLLEAALGKWGYQVISTSSGSEAWEILRREDAPRIAILDWMMPGYSGPELCGLVRRQNKSFYTYIILLTSRQEKEDLIAGMEAGADDYLVKPFDNSELKVRLGPARRIVELQAELLKVQLALREQATKDSLTGLWNRYAIFELLERELSRSHRDTRPLGILMCDFDKFKDVNDTYGHVAGDTVLRETAARMRSVLRPYDSIGRYGGEEFLLLLPGCGDEASLQTAERLREIVQRSPILLPGGSELAITASFGVTSLPEGAPTTSEAVIRIADQALYRAKEEGRNRSVLLPFA